MKFIIHIYVQSIPDDAKDLIKKLLAQNPLKRLGANRNFNALKAHPFFKGIKYDDLHNLEPPIMPKYKKLNTITESGELTHSSKSNFNEEPEIPHLCIDLYQIELQDLVENEKISDISNNLIYYEGKLYF